MQKRTRREFVRDIKTGSALVVLAHVVYIFLLTIFASGCATVPTKTDKIRMPATISGLVRIQQMGNNCTDQVAFLRDTIREIYFQNDLPSPAIIKLTSLSGSSLCGFSQGMASIVAMPELGARDTAVAEAKLYWPAITEKELLHAQTILASMRPLP